MLKFYFGKNTCSLATHIALKEVGANFELVELDMRAGEQCGSEYLKINPKGRVPTLVTRKGVLTETPAILMYIAQSFPDARLAPVEDAYLLAQIQAFNSYLCSTVHVAHAHGMRGARWADDPCAIANLKQKAPQVIGDCFDLIERFMFVGPWVHGEHYTISDPYFFTLGRWLKSDGVDPARFPKLIAHRTRMYERPAVSVALLNEDRLEEELAPM